MQLARRGAMVLGALVALPATAAGQAGARGASTEASLRVYADDDHVTVITPEASATVILSDAVTVDVDVAVDAVSAASVDVITQASPTPVEEVRVEGAAGARWTTTRTTALDASVVASHESDHDSIRVTAGTKLELAQRSASVELAYTAALDRVTSTVDPGFLDRRRGHFALASFSQILDPRSYLDVVVEGRWLEGYHASPYRLVPVLDPVSNELALVPEVTPARRTSVAALGRLRRAVGHARLVFVQASYRLYADSWSITSHTLESRAMTALWAGRMLAGVELRGYTQSAADFYRARYAPSPTGPPDLRTRDRALGGMHSVYLGASADTALGPARSRWQLRTSLGGLQMFFRDYPAQRRRLALIAMVGLTCEL